MALSRDEIKRRFNEWVSAHDGAVPGRDVFEREGQVSQYYWQGKFWSTYSDMQKEFGYESQTLTPPIPRDDLLRHLAELARQRRRFPRLTEVRLAKASMPDFPNETTLRNRLGTMDEQRLALISWIGNHPEYTDVLSFIDKPTTDSRGPVAATHGTVCQLVNPVSESFVPPVIACLEALAVADEAVAAAFRNAGQSIDVAFERRVATAFSIAGFDVERLGQGTGRRPDGIARCRELGWAVLYDAKQRQGPYRLGTEDRKFREYVDHFVPLLQREGIHRTYFAVVSGSFDLADVSRAIHNVVHQTHVRSFAFVPATVLVQLAERRIREPLSYTLTEVEKLFAQTRVIATL